MIESRSFLSCTRAKHSASLFWLILSRTAAFPYASTGIRVHGAMSMPTPDSVFVLSAKKEENPRLVDIGVNVNHKTFKKHWEEVVQRSIDAGVDTLMLTGTCMRGSRESLALARTWHEMHGEKNLFATVGIHPHDAKTFRPLPTRQTEQEGESTIGQMRELLQTDPFAIAVGECGLDYNRNFSMKEDQIHAFREQVRLACELQMPLFVHEREAHSDLVKILDGAQEDPSIPPLPAVVVHCFTGTHEEAMAYIARGYYIGFTGVICKKERGKHLRELLPDVPLDRIMLETDAPFMGFKKGRPRHSEPAHVVDIAKKVSEVVNVPFDEVCYQTTQNARRFFPIGK